MSHRPGSQRLAGGIDHGGAFRRVRGRTDGRNAIALDDDCRRRDDDAIHESKRFALRMTIDPPAGLCVSRLVISAARRSAAAFCASSISWIADS